MKVLLITKNYHGWIASGELDYQQEIAKQADVTFLGSGYPPSVPHYPDFTGNMDLPKYCREHGPFDVILYSQCTTENPGLFKGVKDVPCPKVAYMHNGHNYMQAQITRIHNWDTSLVLFRAWAPHFIEYASKLNCPMKFHPQSINPELFKDYGLAKDLDVNFTGLVVPHYKLRCLMQKRLHELHNQKIMKVAMSLHPGYGNNFDKEYPALKKNNVVWRKDYARLMSRCKTTLTDGGLHNVLVRRYFEAMATKSLLLAPSPWLHTRYGLIPRRHYVPVNAQNWETELHYHLEHYDQFRENIVEPAYEWVMKHHTTPIRVRQLLKILETIIDLDGKWQKQSTLPAQVAS